MDIESIKSKYQEMHDVRMKYAHMISQQNIGVGWPFGWTDIVRRIFELCENHNYQISVAQIKEKFGGLRFYYDAVGEYDLDLDLLISNIECESELTCDICGNPGTARFDGWVVTRCEEHKNMKNPIYGADSVALRDFYDMLDQEFYLRLKQVGVPE